MELPEQTIEQPKIEQTVVVTEEKQEQESLPNFWKTPQTWQELTELHGKWLRGEYPEELSFTGAAVPHDLNDDTLEFLDLMTDIYHVLPLQISKAKCVDVPDPVNEYLNHTEQPVQQNVAPKKFQEVSRSYIELLVPRKLAKKWVRSIGDESEDLIAAKYDPVDKYGWQFSDKSNSIMKLMRIGDGHYQIPLVQLIDHDTTIVVNSCVCSPDSDLNFNNFLSAFSHEMEQRIRSTCVYVFIAYADFSETTNLLQSFTQFLSTLKDEQ